jgi:hypothetical protein
MVRYHEILNEEYVDPNIEETKLAMEKYFPNSRSSQYDYMTGGAVNFKSGRLDLISDIKVKKLPVTFHKVPEELCVLNNELESFEGLPDRVPGSLIFSDNHFTSLQGLPKYVFMLNLEGNPLISLDGLEEKNHINELFLTWHTNLPLLRCILTVNKLSLHPFSNDGSMVENIITDHILQMNKRQEEDYEKMRNIKNITQDHHDIFDKQCKTHRKKAIYDCQYALIKAGFKGNAKW